MGISGSQHALMYALSGRARAGAMRAGYVSRNLFVAVNGVQVATARLTAANKVLLAGVQITEVLHETPNTAAFTTQGIEPTEGQDVVMTLGSINNANREFAGTILNRGHRYIDKPSNWYADLNAIDYTWQLTRRRVTGSWTNTSAATIAAAIVASVPGFTLSVQAGLPTLDAFSYTDLDALSALTRLAKRIGGYCDVDYHKAVKLFITDSSVTNPVSLTSAHLSLTEFSYTKDLSQVRTRLFMEGGGVNALAPCAAGETIIPIGTTAWYNALGGTVKSGTQHITYTGIQVGLAGSIVGPGVTPSGAPIASFVTGAGVESGAHNYAYTWVTGAGETLPSPVVGITLGFLTPPSTIIFLSGPGAGGSLSASSAYLYSTTFVNAAGETTQGPTSGLSTGVADKSFVLTNIPIGPTSTTSRKIYRTAGGGTQLKLLTTIANNLPASFNDTLADGSLGANVPTSNTAAVNQVSLSSVSVGPAGTTSRKVYRTVAAGSQLKLQQTIADNTTTTAVTDATADASLGANAPTSDTSGLAQPVGQLNPGSTSLIASSTAFASATGGWAVVEPGTQVIRYTGISGNTLTGIPATGNGAIVAAIVYNSTIAAAPAIIGVPASGVGSILYDIKQGDAVNLLVQVDDFTAQSALAALVGGGDDGIVEEYVQDGTIGETEARARGTAQLALLSTALVSIRCKTRDVNSHAGRSITVSFGSPTSLSGTFQIQHVTIDGFQYPTLYPTYTVEASSARFSLEDLLRLARAA